MVTGNVSWGWNVRQKYTLNGMLVQLGAPSMHAFPHTFTVGEYFKVAIAHEYFEWWEESEEPAQEHVKLQIGITQGTLEL